MKCIGYALSSILTCLVECKLKAQVKEKTEVFVQNTIRSTWLSSFSSAG